jgi:two-component system CheB/CheR fusion protein
MASFAVAGIGAGADRLDALAEVFRAMPRREDVTFIVASPTTLGPRGRLVDLLRGATPFTVTVAKEGMPIEPEHVYLPSRGRWLTIANGALHLATPPHSDKGPIDHLFESLALEYGSRAAAVLLSETGSDGADGLRAIQQQGGLAVAQHPARVAGAVTPTGALATRRVDSLLAPADIASVLVDFALQRRGIEVERDDPRHAKVAADETKVPLDQIFGLLASRGFEQLLHLRQPVLRRRVERAVRLRKQASLAEYARSLKRDVEEVDALGRELLTTSSRFFRDPSAWDALRETVIAPLISGRAASSGPIRVWAPGCSTGEEAYSIAMLLVEEMSAQGQSMEVRIFASEITDDALGRGRAGFFEDSRLAGVSSDRRERFFARTHDGYLVDRALRDIIVFARHDLLRDPPFSRLDLVICRNLLIHLQPSLRQHVLRVLHYSLVEGGALFLGRAEGVARQRTDRLFETAHAQARIFRRTGGTRRDLDPVFTVRDDGERASTAVSQPANRRHSQLLRRAVVDRFGPPSVLVDRQGRILYLQGDIEKFLAQPPGEPTVDLLSNVRTALREAVRLALRRATDESSAVTVVATRVAFAAIPPAPVEVTVTPLAAGDGDWLFAVSFEAKVRPAEAAVGEARRSVEAEEELQRARDELQVTIERLEESNERLRLANDDVTAMNQELQLAGALEAADAVAERAARGPQPPPPREGRRARKRDQRSGQPARPSRHRHGVPRSRLSRASLHPCDPGPDRAPASRPGPPDHRLRPHLRRRRADRRRQDRHRDLDESRRGGPRS